MRILDECTGDIMVNRNSGVISDVRCEFVCRTSDKKFSKNSNGLPVPKLRSVPKRPSMLRSRSVCSGAQVKNLSDNVDSHSDSSEEFQYGPGIVNKLKTKYLSMTLRENQKYGVRPSLNNLRRATSLENMLDEEAPPPKTVNNLKCFNKYSKSSNPSSKNCYKSTANSMTRNDSLKRAQSMETLVHADTNGSEMRDIKTTPLLNDKCHELNGTKDLVILEKVPQIENGIDNPPLEKTELPPPDVVKQTVKLFEPTSTDKKPAKLKINKVAKPSEVVQSNSVSSPAAISKQIMKGEKPVPLSKPNLSPKPSPEKLHQNQLRKFTPPPKITNSNHVNRSNIHTSTLKFIPTNPMVSKPVLKSPVNIPEINDETVTVKPSESVSSKCTDDDDESSTDESHERLSPDKVVSKDALENIRKGGTSLCFKFKENDKDSNNSPKSYLPASPSEPQKEVPTVIVSPQPTSPVSPPKIQNDVSPESKVSPVNSTPVTHMKQVGVIRPIVSSRQINLPNNMKQNHLTSQEKEKNLINEVKSIEQPVSKVVVAFKTLPSRVSNTVPVEISAHPRGCNSVSSDPSENELKSGGLWEKKPWHHQQNTVVFNFSDRKDVPDYIENDGLIMRSNRDRPVLGGPHETGIIYLGRRRASSEESSTDNEIENDNENESDAFACEEVTRCSVTFIGDNVLINGKSNLKKHAKREKLRIQFKDETTTYEYVSESSLLEDLSPSPIPTCGQSSPSVPSVIGNVSSLSSYTPSKAQLGNQDFQLGVTRASSAVHSTVNVPSSPAQSDQSKTESDYLKPAEDNETLTWSEGQSADLLF
ncbi:uncharacterized protein bif [Bemisia tabaci]|uniref:uncharacterized protein bif n=1 Tax=Bemisia tabaci TaxID=7038 RepID=UPI003B27DF06